MDPGRSGVLGLSLLAGAALVIVVFTVWANAPAASPPPAPVLAPVVAAAPSSPADEKLVVSVVGRVSRPGLVTVRSGARVADALDAAGGTLPGTDIAALNLARRLVDGEQLYVAVPVPPGASATPETAAGGAPPAGSKLDLNTASAAELDALPGIGKVTADKIVQWRTQHGRFASVEQLADIDGIGDTRLARLKELVRT